MHASNISVSLPMFLFLFVFLVFFFYHIAQRFCKNRTAFIFLCTWLFLCPPQLTEQRCFSVTAFSYFKNDLMCTFCCLFLPICFFLLKRQHVCSHLSDPYNTPKEDFSLNFRTDHLPFVCVSKGMFQFTVTSFVFLCNVADCHYVFNWHAVK